MRRRLRTWCRAFATWLVEAYRLWITLGVLAVALIVSLHRGTTDWEIRAAGLALQLFGIGTVALGVTKTRRFFGLPNAFSVLHQWLTRFPRWRQPVIVATGTGSLGFSGGSARLHVRTPMDASAPIDAQVKALIQNVERLDQSVSQVQQEMDAQFHK